MCHPELFQWVDKSALRKTNVVSIYNAKKKENCLILQVVDIKSGDQNK